MAQADTEIALRLWAVEKTGSEPSPHFRFGFRRIEVNLNGPPFWKLAYLALDQLAVNCRGSLEAEILSQAGFHGSGPGSLEHENNRGSFHGFR